MPAAGFITVHLAIYFSQSSLHLRTWIVSKCLPNDLRHVQLMLLQSSPAALEVPVCSCAVGEDVAISITQCWHDSQSKYHGPIPRKE